MKRYLSIIASVAIFGMCTPEGSGSSDRHELPAPKEKAQYDTLVTNGTLVRTSCADPCLIYQDGTFYLTMTGSSNLIMVIDSDLTRLTTKAHPTGSCEYIYKSEQDPNIKKFFGTGATLSGTWSPELHYISEADIPGHSGWYMFFGVRKSGDDSSMIRTVILKSRTGELRGPYVHPSENVQYSSQTLLDINGKEITEWIVGMSILRIPSGKYKGLYGMFVDEVGRGEGYGKFYQRLRIAKLEKPWKLGSDLHTITTPTQAWEKIGADSIRPMVVEGCTAIYGDDNEIFLAYCGSGYWSNYGLGQLTLRRENGDYSDPLQESSWIKYEKNPVFTSSVSDDLRGAGHAFFLKDDTGNRFMCYHAYPLEGGVKSASRNAYIEPYTIDYSIIPDSAPQGVIKFGACRNGVSAPVSTPVTFYKKQK